jgi:hypothetical protein
MVDAMTKSILGLTTGLQATALLGENIGYLNSKKKKKKGGMIGLGVKNIVGTGMISAQAGMINAL